MIKTELKPLIFVSSPYTHKDPAVTAQRVELTMAFVHDRLLKGEVVMSPIIYGHNIVQTLELPNTYEFWVNFCLSQLQPCQSMYVLCLDGWRESTGMNGKEGVIEGEIPKAQELGLPLVYVLNLRLTSEGLRYELSDTPPAE